MNPTPTLVLRAREWFERATSAGWFDETDRRRINSVEKATPADLFAVDQIRPLVVALFGGTGVGKSSLLNQLAGETVARVGVERPTSRDVTMYVHESVQLAALPPELPVDRIQIKRHGSTAFREVLWIDAPDIDSIEEANRQCGHGVVAACGFAVLHSLRRNAIAMTLAGVSCVSGDTSMAGCL